MRKLSLLALSALFLTTACKKDLADDSSTYNDVTLFTEMTVPAGFEYKSSQLATVDVTIDGTE